MARFFKALFVVGVVAACSCMFAACSGSSSEGAGGSVAATVTMHASGDSTSSDESASSDSAASSASAESSKGPDDSSEAAASDESASSEAAESSESSASAEASDASASAESASSASAGETESATIYEDEITETIQNLRAQYSLEEEDAWGEYLVSNDITPESLREQVIDSRVNEELAKFGAQLLGITVDSSEVDTYVESMKANFDDDDAWQEALTQAGFTLESYRESIETSLTQQAISQHFEDEAKVDDDDIVSAAETYLTYYDGAKRSSHILIGVDDVDDEKAMKKARKQAQELIDQIKNGEISFADAAKQNSTDTGSAANGGDVGWDVLNSFVTEYTDALADLEKGDISNPVDSQYGVHIITVTDVYDAPEKVKSVKDVPEDFRSTIEDYAKSMKASEDYNNWIEELKENADIQINDMPVDVPYNIDLTKYQEAAKAEGDDSGESDGDDAESSDGEDSEIELDAEGDEVVELSDDEAADAESSESASAESASAESADGDDSESSSASAESAG